MTSRNLATALAQAEKPPQAFLCASAIGYYGNRGDEILTEESPPGRGFLAGVSLEWEQATHPALQAGIRVVNLRIGIVLSQAGGALRQMLLPFRFGLGGRIGDGQQWFAWIHVEDLAAAVVHILDPAKAIVELSHQRAGQGSSSASATARLLTPSAAYPGGKEQCP